MRLAGLIIGLLLMSGCSKTTPDTEKAKPDVELSGRVVDDAGIIDAAAEARIAEKLAMAERLYGPQMVVVTVPSLKGRPIADYSIDLARAWGIGHSKRNDGLLLLVAPKERQLRIEVGTGLESSFTAQFASKVINETITPAFKHDAYARGVEAGVERIIARMKAAPTLRTNDNRPALDPRKVA